MADARRLELLEHRQHPAGAGVRGLAGMHRGPELGAARALEQIAIAQHLLAELERVLLRPGQVDPDHAAPGVLDRFAHQDLVELVTELARQAEDDPGTDAVLETGAVHPAQGGGDDVVEVALAAEIALHGVEAKLEQGNARGAILLAYDFVDRAL